MSGLQFLYDGTGDGPWVVLAHGAGAPMDSEFMNRMASGLAGAGLRCARFEFPYMQKRRATGTKSPPDRAPKLLAAWREVITRLGGPEQVIIGGKSMGGRMASMIAAELEGESTPVNGVVCLGYPFHPPGRPENLRVDHLFGLKTPTLIVQGTRDSLGNQQEVATYALPSTIAVHWLDDGDHSFKPRVKSGRTLDQNIEEAVVNLAAFAKSC